MSEHTRQTAGQGGVQRTDDHARQRQRQRQQQRQQEQRERMLERTPAVDDDFKHLVPNDLEGTEVVSLAEQVLVELQSSRTVAQYTSGNVWGEKIRHLWYDHEAETFRFRYFDQRLGWSSEGDPIEKSEARKKLTELLDADRSRRKNRSHGHPVTQPDVFTVCRRQLGERWSESPL